MNITIKNVFKDLNLFNKEEIDMTVLSNLTDLEN